MEYHNPVLLKETVDGLNIKPDGIYVDVTFGGGGHSKEILDRLGPNGRLFAFDQDEDALENALPDERFELINENFRFIKRFLRFHNVRQVDGILADLGVSSHQFDEASRGFSIRAEAALDMRMNQHGDLTAEKVVNDYEQDDLLRVLRTYGEISNAWKLVNMIIAERRNKRIKTTGQFLEIVEKCAPKHREHKYFAQVFQAIRIEVNDEMGALEAFLKQSEKVLKPGGRLVVMSYHSLEDRLVKNFMKRGSLSGEIEKDFFGNVLKPFTEIVRHPIVADAEELERNSRARSAKLRIAERNGE